MENLFKRWFDAFYRLFTFKTSYRNMPRWLEIGYSILAWFCLYIIIYPFLKLF